MADARERALENYRRKLVEHRELEAKLKKERQAEQKLNKDFEKSEDDLKALQSVGQIVGEVLKQLTEEKFIVKVRLKAMSGFVIIGMLASSFKILVRDIRKW